MNVTAVHGRIFLPYKGLKVKFYNHIFKSIKSLTIDDNFMERDTVRLVWDYTKLWHFCVIFWMRYIFWNQKLTLNQMMIMISVTYPLGVKTGYLRYYFVPYLNQARHVYCHQQMFMAKFVSFRGEDYVLLYLIKESLLLIHSS